MKPQEAAPQENWVTTRAGGAGAPLSQEDCFTLLGHATVLLSSGEKDMPAFFYGLAERIALSIGEKDLATRMRDVAREQSEQLAIATSVAIASSVANQPLAGSDPSARPRG